MSVLVSLILLLSIAPQSASQTQAQPDAELISH
jgi:hypothetical protein